VPGLVLSERDIDVTFVVTQDCHCCRFTDCVVDCALPMDQDVWLGINAERAARLPVVRLKGDPPTGAYALALRRGQGKRD
jgi:hypothetical protein